MVITDIKISGKMCQVVIDNEVCIDMPYLIAFDFRLEKGAVIDQNKLSEIENAVNEKLAFDYCVWYLSKYSTTAKKMASKLYEKGYHKQVVDKVTNKLNENSLLDDYRYAENFIAKKSQKLGTIRLKSELRAKGVDLMIIDEILSQTSCDDNFATALSVGQKWYRSHTLDTPSDYQKFVRFMAYRGFDYATIKNVREELLFGKND